MAMLHYTESEAWKKTPYQIIKLFGYHKEYNPHIFGQESSSAPAQAAEEFDVGAKVNVGKELTDDYDDKKPKPRGGGSAAGGVVVNQYIYANTTDYAKQQTEAARQFRMIARTV